MCALRASNLILPPPPPNTTSFRRLCNYPEVNLDNTIEAKQNEAYVASTDIIVKGNQAYVTSIITEKNAAYKPVTTVETVDEYDYI